MRQAIKVMAMLAAAAMVLPALAQTIYQGRDAKGNPVYTDQPRAGDRPVELPPINTTPATGALPAAPQRQPGFAGYAQIVLSAPGSVPNDFVPIAVGIAIEPVLLDGHLWRLYVDGEFVAVGREASYSIPSLARGQHTLTLQVLDGSGQVVGEAAPVNVFVQFVKSSR